MVENIKAKISEFEEVKGQAAPADKQLVVDVGGFEGPIDVLLNLAREQKVDLTQISILELADQYLAWVAKLRQTNLELAADYLVMAAWLAYLKSRLLLPDFSEEDVHTGEQMSAALQFQLQRLESMQTAGATLLTRDRLGKDFFARGEPEKFGYTANTTFDANIFDLLSAYGDHVYRSKIKTLRIEPSDLYSPDDAISWLTSMLGSISDWTNLSLFLPHEIKGDLISRSMMASALVAALQLTKEGQLQIRQIEDYGTVYVRLAQLNPQRSAGSTQQSEEIMWKRNE